ASPRQTPPHKWIPWKQLLGSNCLFCLLGATVNITAHCGDHGTGKVVPDGKYCTGQRGKRAEVGCGQGGSHAGVLHADLNSHGAAYWLGLAGDLACEIAQQVAQAVVNDDGDKHDATGGDDVIAVATDDDAHNGRDSEDGNPWQQWRNGFYDLGYQQTHNQAGDNWNPHYLDDVPGHGPGIQRHGLAGPPPGQTRGGER